MTSSEVVQVLRLLDSSNRRDIGKLLDGVLLGMLACILFYTAFGLLLVRTHADMIASKMQLFLLNDMPALIMPDDPYLKSFHHQLGSALMFGITLGALTALLTSTVSVVSWARGHWGKTIEPLLTLMLVPLYLHLTFSKDMPALSIVWSILTPFFFWIPWIYAVESKKARRRNRLRLSLFTLVFLLPLFPFANMSPGDVRDTIMDLPIGNSISNFYYSHTLLAAHVIKPVRYRAQKVIAVSEDIEVSGNLPSGTLWIRHPEPCAVKGSSLVISKRELDCPCFVFSDTGDVVKAHELVRKASTQFDNNKAIRRGVRWFLNGGFFVTVLLLVLRFAIFVEDVYSHQRGIAILLLAGSLLLTGRGFYNRALLDSLLADPNRTNEYATSSSTYKRYLSLTHYPYHLPKATLELMARDPSPAVRHYTFVAMGESMDPSHLHALTEGLTDPEQIVRTKVCKALGEIGGEDALRLLDQAIAQDPSWYVRYYAYEAKSRTNRVSKMVEQM